MGALELGQEVPSGTEGGGGREGTEGEATGACGETAGGPTARGSGPPRGHERRRPFGP